MNEYSDLLKEASGVFAAFAEGMHASTLVEDQVSFPIRVRFCLEDLPWGLGVVVLQATWLDCRAGSMGMATFRWPDGSVHFSCSVGTSPLDHHPMLMAQRLAVDTADKREKALAYVEH